LKKLEREKNDAVKYEKLKREVRESEGILLKSRYLEIKSEIDDLDKRLNFEENRRGKLNDHLRILQKNSEIKKQELENLNAAIIKEEGTGQFEVYKESEKLKNEVLYDEEKLRAIEEQLKSSEERYEYAKSEVKRIQNEIEEYRKINDALIGERGEIEKTIAELKAEADGAYSQITQEDRDAFEHKEDLLKLKKEIDNEQENLFELERSNTILKEQKQQKSAILNEINGQIEEKKNKLKNFEDLINNTRSSIDEINIKIEKNKRNKKHLYKENIENKESISKLNKILENKIGAYAKLNAKYKALEEINERNITFNNAIDAILALRDNNKIGGIYGTISELGKVDRRFSKALEIAAGKGLHYIVVKDDVVAEKCIRYLKKNRIGRADFLPLNKLRTRHPSINAIAAAKRSHGFAIDLIEFDKRFEKAFLHVFKDTVVVEDIDFARKIGIGKVRMVTLDGDLIEVSGRMSGGHYEKRVVGFEESDASKRELEELAKEIDALEKERGALMKESKVIDDELEKVTVEGLELEKELEILHEKLRSHEEGIDEITRDIGRKNETSTKLSAELEKIDGGISKNDAALEKVSSTIAELKEKQKAIEKLLEGSRAEDIYNGIKELESKIFQLEKERESKNNQIDLNSSKIEKILVPKLHEYEEEIESIDSNIGELNRNFKDISEHREDIEKRLIEAKDRESDVLGKVAGLKERREKLLKAVAKINTKNEGIRNELHSISGNIEEIKVGKARLETRLGDVQVNLEEYADLEINLEEPIDLEALESKIGKLKARIERLEPINMRAIEDYETVNEKYGKLFEKIEKLMAEKRAIRTLMEEIEHRKLTIFMEAFENIHMNFRRIFSQLSGGGTGELFLDPEMPLEGGLMIRAKPPGKNPQLLESLSGGEKTLTALSFIFAIQRYQPAPFYVMDEIDMYLDDDNLVKITDLIKDSSKEAQFIVVSLRDTLMSSADHLFGISSDDGVSKIIGVELEEVGS
ncbi:MAG: hypothetical protein ACE5PM_02600, partial [Candidatus Hydrothermarchaeales archaeon]